MQLKHKNIAEFLGCGTYGKDDNLFLVQVRRVWVFACVAKPPFKPDAPPIHTAPLLQPFHPSLRPPHDAPMPNPSARVRNG